MKYPVLILTSGAVMLFVLSVPVAWGQNDGPSSTIRANASNAADTRGAAAMAQDVARGINQAWSEGKDASGAAAFRENGEIALSEGKEQQAIQYFQQAERELDSIDGPTSAGTSGVAKPPVANNENASTMDQQVSAMIKQAWSEGKDASGAAAFHENGEVALSEGKEPEAKRFFQAAAKELATLNAESNN